MSVEKERRTTMKLSDGVEWGVHCVALLAAIPPNTVLSGADLAQFHGVSESYLLKHLRALAAAGILDALPGPRGGYRLARAARDLTLLDLVEAIEGTEPAFRCTEIRQRGPTSLQPAAYPLPCPINAAMLRAEVAWREALRATTVADLVQAVGQQANPRAVEQGLAWISAHQRAQ
jgi:Rrf2 family protein